LCDKISMVIKFKYWATMHVLLKILIIAYCVVTIIWLWLWTNNNILFSFIKTKYYNLFFRLKCIPFIYLPRQLADSIDYQTKNTILWATVLVVRGRRTHSWFIIINKKNIQVLTILMSARSNREWTVFGSHVYPRKAMRTNIDWSAPGLLTRCSAAATPPRLWFYL